MKTQKPTLAKKCSALIEKAKLASRPPQPKHEQLRMDLSIKR